MFLLFIGIVFLFIGFTCFVFFISFKILGLVCKLKYQKCIKKIHGYNDFEKELEDLIK